MKNTHDHWFCKEEDFLKNVHLVNSYGDDYIIGDKKFYNPGDMPACNPQVGCEVIQDFLENEDVKDRNPSKYEIPACNPENSCEVIQDFLEEGGVDKFSIFRSAQNKCYEEIYQCQNRIEECKKKIRAEIQDIQVYKQRLDEVFNQYIE